MRSLVAVFTLPVLLAGAVAVGAEPQPRTADKRKSNRPPNVVLFLIDDLGYTDVGCYGSDFYETPNIDGLARDGMRFTEGYAACCVCSPTRVSVLTGKNPARLHITHAIPIQGHLRLKGPLPLIPAIYCKNLPLEEVTIAEALKPAGYRSASVGKWHACWEKEFFPEHQGFDVNVAGNNMGNPGTYFHPYRGRWRMTPEHPWTDWQTIAGGQPGEYLTDRLTDEAIRFIEESSAGPFLLYFPHYAVHTPLEAKKALIEKYRGKPAGERHTNPVYAAMIESVDQSIGRVLAKLDELGLADDTVVIFSSDNGGHGRITSHYPLRGCKGNFYEGGIRVPLIVRWPGMVEPGAECHTPVITHDFHPTLLQIAGQPLMPEQHVDGVSLMPLLKQTGDLKPRPLFWHFPNYIGATHVEPARPQSVIRDGDWKLFEFLEDGRLELYNLREDIAECNNLAARMPEKAKQLHEKLTAWREAAKVQMPRQNPEYLESRTHKKGPASRLNKHVEIAGKTFALDALPRQLSLVSDVGVVVPADLCRVQTIGPRFAHGTIYGPRAVKAPNGDYLVFGAGGGYYQRSEDKVNQAWMWRSTDQGKTWDEGIQPWSQNASEHCLVPMVDPAEPKRIYVFGNASRSRTHSARMVFRYTDDNGCTWSKPRSIVPENDPKFPGAPIHMRGAVMPDGTWLWGAYYRIGSVGDTQYMLRSTDRGMTWSIAPDGHPKGWTHATWDKFMEGIVVPTGGNNATLYLRAPGGRMYEKRTTDSGLTWSETRDVPDLVHPDAPPMVFRLADGQRLIAFVHNRYDLKHPHHYHPDRVELWFATSEDQGRSWSEPRFVIGQAKRTERPLSCDPDVSYVDLLVDGPALHLFVGDGQRQTVHVQFSQQELDAFPTEAAFGVDELSTEGNCQEIYERR